MIRKFKSTLVVKWLKRLKSHYDRTSFDKNQFSQWKRDGRTIPPPPIIKQLIVKRYQRKFQYPIFVETGTYLGEMVEAQKGGFKKIISIELGIDLFNKAVLRFKNDDNVTILQGDSGTVLHRIIDDINEPTIFWLDGHYSEGITAKGEKECPILEELDAILTNPQKFNHILLIDDARCFIGRGDYPTVSELTKYIRARNEKYRIEVKDDVIRCTVK